MSEPTVFLSQRLYEPFLNRYFHLFVAAENVDEVRSRTKIPRSVEWVPLYPEDRIFDVTEYSRYYAEATRKPGTPICDLFEIPSVYHPWRTNELIGPGFKLVIEVPENGDDPKVCGSHLCGKTLPSGSFRVAYEKDGEPRSYLCADCAKAIVTELVKNISENFLQSNLILFQIDNKMSYERRTEAS